MDALLVLAGTATPAPPAAARESATTRGPTPTDRAARQERRRMALHRDGEGRVSRAGLLARRQSHPGAPATHLAALDRDRDGVLERFAVRTAATRRFARPDANRAGLLSSAERARPAGAAEPPPLT